VNFFAEGEAQRYSEHAMTLLYTIQSLRSTSELDLIRGESLLNLEGSARLKVIEKSYKMLISMAPIAADVKFLINNHQILINNLFLGMLPSTFSTSTFGHSFG
jgi:hypothetical protein